MKNCLPTNKKDPKQILLAPNAFKGTLEASEFCRIMCEELTTPELSPICLPMCDGGDGTAAILATYLQALPVTFPSVDALGRPHLVTYYTNRDTAILDLASICGLKDLQPAEYDVLNANTAGLGKVLLHIKNSGIRRILLGVGGSASIDGGTGALVEMGMKIVKQEETYQNYIIDLEDIEIEELKENFKDVELLVLCDVNNLLCGPEGAAMTFGPQKGAKPLQVSMLDEKLQYYACVLEKNTGTDIFSLRHGGAAGGVAAAFHALLGARLILGADYCLRLSGFEDLLATTDLVITGEGKLDSQSMQGKLPGTIASLCHPYRIPVIAVSGIAESSLSGFTQVYALIDYAPNLPASLRQPGYYLRVLANDLKKNILKLI